MTADIQQVAQLLQASLDPRQSRDAEVALRQAERQPKFSITLLQVVASDSHPQTTRLASALFFKNFVRRNWTDAEGAHKLPQDEVGLIKQQLVGLMITVPPTIQAQLGDAVSVIADSDFWERWDTLVDDLVSRLSQDDPIVNNGVLQVAHSIFRRWRPLFRSDALFTEINHVLSKFSKPFLILLQNIDTAISDKQHDATSLKQWTRTLGLSMQLFYDLSCQDLPPDFEENLSAITGLLQKYIIYDNPILHTDDDAESGPLESLKADIFEALVLYVQKYGDAFDPLLQPFISSSWNLLTTIGAETRYDLLVSRALQFLTSVASNRQHAESFNNEAVLGDVVEKVIIPNLTLRDADVELFEDDPIEFIRRDLEGADSDTRRRATTDFLRTLMQHFEPLITTVVSRYINHFLAEYAKDGKSNWKAKDTAVYLFTAIAAKGAATSSQGVTNTNSFVNIVEFFQSNEAADLTSDEIEPLLKVDAIKFLYIFRSQMSRPIWQSAFPLLVKHLGASNHVVYTYAAIAIERILSLTNAAGQTMIAQEDVVPLAKELLQQLFKLITRDSAPEKIQENEFLMRCVMRVLLTIRDKVRVISDMVLKNFVAITMVIRHNPSNPRFYYYHFEGIGALIRFAAPADPETFESVLYNPFGDILRSGVEEFMPYVFQLFAALLEANPSGALPDTYKGLLGPLLTPTLWEQRGNIPALVRLLSSIVPRGTDEILKNNQIEPILGIFQLLIASKVNDVHGFDLLEIILSSFQTSALQNYYTQIVSLMLTRLSNSKTESFTLRFIRFYYFVAAHDKKGLGADFFINITDQVQQNVFTPIYTQIIIPDTQKLTRPVDRKTAVIALTKTLSDSNSFVDRYGKRGWALTCEALLKLLVNPPLPSQTSDDVIPDADVEDIGFGVGYTPLSTCRRPVRDPFPEVQDVKGWVGSYLKGADERHAGRVGRFVQDRLTPEGKEALMAVM
ncbi:Cse1-domain-containing protein [Viridothelium virens]|uniref:Cse1-domain-containing protein n=1 Tax=Viridothelium virens TaxID=1048519 RepID=A0A6A6GUA9_VIRVR|nr:Cse1-domain-containing protein [Viridothelium virens]